MAREGCRGLDSGGGSGSFEELWERERLLNAILEQTAHEGLDGCTAEAICARTGVPSAAFRSHFEDVAECFNAACDSQIQQLMARTISAYHAPRDSWLERVRAALGAYLAGVCARPEAARAYLLQPPYPAAGAEGRRERAIALLETTIAEMLRDLPGSERLDWVTVTGIAGGIARVVERRLREGRAHELPELLQPMLAWALTQLPEYARPAEIAPPFDASTLVVT